VAEDQRPAPAAWCRRILATLCERAAEGEEAAYLQLLLTCLIDLDPPADEFDGLLARYRRDHRPGIAEAAAVLQDAWQRATAPEAEAPEISLAERLRIAGALLDQARARAAVVQVSPERLRIDLYGGGRYSLGPLELRHELAGRTVLRGRVVGDDPRTLQRHEVRLRVIGFALMDIPSQAYEVFVTPRAVVVEGAAGYFQVFTEERLARLAEAAMAQRQPAAT
jgi:hypothetical protein